MRLLFVLIALACAACGGAKAPPVAAPTTPRHPVEQSAEPSGPRPTGGSSDGVSCEDARDQNVEEVNIGKASGPDLSVKDLGAVLNDGKFLQTCDVPSDVKVSVCAAVKQGQVVGVTVAMLPPNPELETCVAKEIRGLTFPSNPKMDIVKTEF
jgi:eukaryotic-like serine/threonine-protein kinase